MFVSREREKCNWNVVRGSVAAQRCDSWVMEQLSHSRAARAAARSPHSTDKNNDNTEVGVWQGKERTVEGGRNTVETRQTSRPIDLQ